MSHSAISILKKAIKLITAGNFDKAESLCDKVLKKNPQHADALYLSGRIALYRNDYSRAVQAYKNAIAIKPDKASAYRELCLALTKSGDFEAAIEAGQTAIVPAPPPVSG